MKRLAILAAIAVVCFFALPAHAAAQMTQTSYQVNLSWTAPSVCTAAAPCTYPVFRTSVAAGATCPLTASSYTQIGSSTSQTVTYSDSTVAASTSYCYVLQTSQAGALSAPTAPFSISVPTGPVAPTAPSATTVTVVVTVTAVP